MDTCIVLFGCLQVLTYFLLKGKRKGKDNTCFVCLDPLQDEVETVCGHFICCN